MSALHVDHIDTTVTVRLGYGSDRPVVPALRNPRDVQLGYERTVTLDGWEVTISYGTVSHVRHIPIDPLGGVAHKPDEQDPTFRALRDEARALVEGLLDQVADTNRKAAAA